MVNIDRESNVGVPGLFVYRVDQNEVIEPGCNNTQGTYNNYRDLVWQYVEHFHSCHMWCTKCSCCLFLYPIFIDSNHIDFFILK